MLLEVMLQPEGLEVESAASGEAALLAIATLTQSQAPELQELIRTTKVNVEDKRVMVELAIPIEAALKQIDEHHGGDKPPAKKHETKEPKP